MRQIVLKPGINRPEHQISDLVEHLESLVVRFFERLEGKQVSQNDELTEHQHVDLENGVVLQKDNNDCEHQAADECEHRVEQCWFALCVQFFVKVAESRLDVLLAKLDAVFFENLPARKQREENQQSQQCRAVDHPVSSLGPISELEHGEKSKV